MTENQNRDNAAPEVASETDAVPVEQKGQDVEIDRRKALRALAKYSVGAGSAAVVVLSSKDALSMGFLSVCNGASPPPWCP